MAYRNERRTYIPLALITDWQGKPEVSLDYMQASYIGMENEVVVYDTHVVREEEESQPDAIAHRFYGDSKLWWLIAEYNGLVDPYTEIRTGRKLKIPRLADTSLFLHNRVEKTANAVGTTASI